MRCPFIPSLTVASLTSCLLMSLSTGASAQQKIYVATNGNDSWSGMLAAPNGNGDGPKRTLEGARNLIRLLKLTNQLSNKGAVVTVRPGRYKVMQPFLLEVGDSGASGARIIYRSEVPGQAILDGGKEITRWVPGAQRPSLDKIPPAARGKIQVAILGENGITEVGRLRHMSPYVDIPTENAELFFGESRMPLVQWPNANNWCYMSGLGTGNGPNTPTVKAYVSSARTPDYVRVNQIEPETDYWIRGVLNESQFNQFQERVTFFNKITKDVRIAIEDGNVNDQARRAKYQVENIGRFKLVNSLYEMDAPGEYYFDRANLLLYFYPPAALAGNRPYVSMNPGPMVNIVGAKYLDVQGFLIEGGRNHGVNVVNGVSVVIRGNKIRNVGSVGVKVEGGSAVTVRSCEITGTGETGIVLRGGDRAALLRGNHLAENNYVHHVGEVQPYYRPCIELTGYGLTARKNELCYHRHQAINYFGNELLMEYNKIHHVILDACDAAAIYTDDGDWTTRGNVIRYNYISDVKKNRPGYHGVHGVYLDNMNSSTFVYSNIFQRVEQPIQIGGGHNNRVEYNLFLDSIGGVRIDDRGLTAPQSWMDDFFRNALAVPWQGAAWRAKYPEVYDLLTGNDYRWPSGNTILGNVAQRCETSDRIGGIYELWGVNKNAPEWILKYEKNVRTMAQQFVNEKLGDFTPKDGSAAKANGFSPINMADIGVQQDAFIKPPAN